jgi:hypothetical protein
MGLIGGVGSEFDTIEGSVDGASQMVASDSASTDAKAGPRYTSIFFDTSMLPHNEAVPALSPTLESPREGQSPSASPSARAKPTGFFADFTFETHLPPTEKPDWYSGDSPSGSYSSLPTSSTDLNPMASLANVPISAGSKSLPASIGASVEKEKRPNGSPSRRRSSITSQTGSPSNPLYESIYMQKMREQGSRDDSSGDWGSSRRRNLFGANEEKEEQKRPFRTEVVDVGEYTRTGGRSAFLGSRKS